MGKSIKSWEAQFRIENNRNPSTDEKIRNLEYSRYRVLKSRRNFLQDLQQQTAPESFQYSKDVNNIHKLSPTLRHQHNDVTNITVTVQTCDVRNLFF